MAGFKQKIEDNPISSIVICCIFAGGLVATVYESFRVPILKERVEISNAKIAELEKGVGLPPPNVVRVIAPQQFDYKVASAPDTIKKYGAFVSTLFNQLSFQSKNPLLVSIAVEFSGNYNPFDLTLKTYEGMEISGQYCFIVDKDRKNFVPIEMQSNHKTKLPIINQGDSLLIIAAIENVQNSDSLKRVLEIKRNSS